MLPNGSRRGVARVAAWLLNVLAVAIWPGAWVVVGVHHRATCGSTWFFCDEPLVTFALHQALTSLSPLLALAVIVVAENTRRTR